MNNAGEEGISEGFRLAKSERAVPGGVGAEARYPPILWEVNFRRRMIRIRGSGMTTDLSMVEKAPVEFAGSWLDLQFVTSCCLETP